MLNTLFDTAKTILVQYGYLLELLGATLLFTMYFQKKPYFWAKLAAFEAAAVLIAETAFRMDFHRSVWWELLYYFIIYVLYYLLILTCFEVSLWIALYCLILISATQHISYRIFSVILSFSGLTFSDNRSGIINACLIALVYSVIYLSFRKQLKEIAEKAYKSKDSILLGIFAFLVAIVLYRFEDTFHFIWTNSEVNLLFASFSIMANIFCLMVLHGVIVTSRMSAEVKSLESMIDRQKKQYEFVKTNIDNVNIKCHDMKQQISTLKNRVDPDALEEIQTMIKVYDTTFKTGNEVLDVFLQEKLMICEKDGITLDCIVDGESVAFMKPGDLYALVGNAIDNAVEAVRQLPNRNQRIITFSIRKQMNLALIHIDNAYTGIISFQNGVPKSTKGDPFNHGYGVRSMRMIAERYGGSLNTKADNGIFHLNIILPIPETNAL